MLKRAAQVLDSVLLDRLLIDLIDAALEEFARPPHLVVLPWGIVGA